eukprot:m.111350 g.111350  ORF g.111350 m.111350 type:complete len:615 (-) comp28115_c0_seq1:975-2819(-)
MTARLVFALQLSLLILQAQVHVSALLSPIATCESLASAALGPNVSILSAEVTTSASSYFSTAPEQASTCTFEDGIDVGQPSTIITAIKDLVDQEKCCAACYANPKCAVAAVLPASYGSNCGCWLKTGSGATEKKPNVTICRTTRTPAPPPAASYYCLVKVLVQPAINIWVGLPMNGTYNDRFMALGGGGFVGSVGEPTSAVSIGYAGATTDTGHKGSSGSFGMLKPGEPDVGLQTDFGWRSEHMMAVVGKQLIQLFYGKQPQFSYWNGCSTGGRQGQAMIQRFPDDYDGALTGAPAIHFEKLGLGQTWPQVPMLMENGGKAIDGTKLAMAQAAAIQACDMLDGVKDGVLRDPRACTFSATALIGPSGLTAAEAKAIDMIWHGSTNVDGTLSWYGIPRGASLDALAGETIMSIPDGQAKYWVEFNASWDYHSLTYDNYPQFFDKSVKIMEPGPTATDNAKSISSFRDKGGKVIMWHGWADQIIMPQGSIDYYNQVINISDGGNLTATQEWFRFFMAPGVAHCGMDTFGYFEALVNWVENGTAPETIAHKVDSNNTRPLCPHPHVAVYKGSGSTNDPNNFACGPNPVGADTEDCDARVNNRLFGMPFVPSAPCPGC